VGKDDIVLGGRREEQYIESREMITYEASVGGEVTALSAGVSLLTHLG